MHLKSIIDLLFKKLFDKLVSSRYPQPPSFMLCSRWFLFILDRVMSSTCPKCSNDQWKSARLVIAEGTTNSTSSLTGSITERGSMSINPKDWYLADRWFSYDSPIEADMGTV